MIKVALPNKGQLFEPTMDILAACGYKVSKSLRSLSTLDNENGVEFFFLRPGDIPIYVANGILDAGITGSDFVAERRVSPNELLKLNYGASKLCLATPGGKSLNKKFPYIATSFPNITRDFFQNKPMLKKLGSDVEDIQMVELEGAVEISVKLGIAEAVVDIVETGTTLKQAGLEVIATLFESQATLYSHPAHENKIEISVLKKRLEGKLLAMEYMMVEYDVPEGKKDAACAITPGIESPTVTSLAKAGWFSVKSMIRKRGSQKIMDELSKLGCKGILLTSIDSARI